jgi:TonB family protein
VLEVLVSREGKATEVKVLKSVGYGLDEEAIKAVKTWKFQPGVGPKGEPVETLIPIEVYFKL